MGRLLDEESSSEGDVMPNRKTFSTMEIVLLILLIGSLLLSFFQGRQEEETTR